MKWILQIVLFYSFSLVSNSALGQSNKIDSLKARLELHPQEDSIHLDLILKLSEAHVYFNRDTMLNYAIRGKKLAMELNSPAQFLYALQREGAFYYAKFALDTALEIFSLGYRMSVAENILERQSAFLGSIGITRFQQGLTDTALHYLKMAFETDQRLGDSVKMMVRLNNIGAVYHAIDDPANSLRYLYQSLKIAEALNIPEKVALTANNIAVLYQRYDNKEKALLFFKLSLKNMEGESIARTALLVNIGDLYLQMEVMDTALYYFRAAESRQHISEVCDQITAEVALMDIYLRQSKMDSARWYFSKAEKLTNSCRDSSILFQFHRVAGRFYTHVGNFKEAGNEFDKAAHYGQEQFRDFNLLFLDLSALEEKRGNLDLALDFYKDYNNYRETFLSDTYNGEVARTDLEVSYNNEKKALIEAQAKETALIRSDLIATEARRNFWLSVSISLVLLAIILALFYRNRRKAAKSLESLNLIISGQKENLQSKTEQLALSNKRIKELSDFRERLAAMAVHDMKNPLSTIIGLSQGSPTEKRQKLIHKAGNQILNFITDMLNIYKFEQAKIALKLHPHSISEIVKEAQHTVEYLAEEKDITLESRVRQGLIVPVDEGILVRVLTNILSNAIKYSDVNSKVVISAEINHEEERPKLQLGIRDFGKGLSTEALEQMFQPLNLRPENYISKSKSTGIGLDFCKLAIQAHHGKIGAQSQLGNGTLIKISLPLHEEIKMEPMLPVESILEELDNSVEPSIDQELNILFESKIHEAGKILPILQKIEDLGGDPSWVAKVKATVYGGDAERYIDLINRKRN